ncbi:MAG: NAD(P)H-hydrate epimerase [Acidimicrobiia bacterium]
MVAPQFTGAVPTVTADQMAEADRLATGPYGIDLLQMMELAGRALARIAQDRLDSSPPPVTVVAGGGGNGGGAMAAARRLRGFGFDVTTVLDREPGRLTGAAAHQATSLEAIGSRPSTRLPSEPGAVIVDGLIGYGLTDAPTGRAAELIDWMNASASTVISLDVPSGSDATTGESPGAVVGPDVILTLALPKSGFVRLPSDTTLLLADIAVPAALWRDHFGLDTLGLFATSDVVDISQAQLADPPVES